MADKNDHILVVDDEPSMRELLEILFTKEGYRVDTAESGKQAIRMQAKTAYERSGDHDFSLCDHRTGGGGHERRRL